MEIRTSENPYLRERKFFVGNRYSIADIALYAYTHVADEGGFDLGRFPAIAAWIERVRDQPGHPTDNAGLTGGVMSLEMRTVCERCGAALDDDGPAFICSYECTFCASCTTSTEHVCPNCGGELVPRPRRRSEGTSGA